jgi:hypothetical protein
MVEMIGWIVTGAATLIALILLAEKLPPQPSAERSMKRRGATHRPNYPA